MKTLLLAASLLALSPCAVLAADLAPTPVEPAAPVALPYSWTGFYVGAQAGYAWANSDTHIVSPDVGPFGKASNDPDGAFGGLYAGYNQQFGGNLVLGVEGDINVADIKSNNPYISNGVLAPAGVVLPFVNDFKQEWSGSVRLRAGYAFDRFLPYVTGGVAFGDIKATITPTLPDVFAGKARDNRAGWTVGAGVEYAFTDNISGRVEYRYADYGTAKLPAIAGGPGNLPTDLKVSDVRAGVSYKF